MQYRAAVDRRANRCGFAFDEHFHRLGISREQAVALLAKRGIRQECTNWLELARRITSLAQFVPGASYDKAPNLVDCASFTKYIFASMGISIPRTPIQQWDMWPAIPVTSLRRIRFGDLIFRTSTVNMFHLSTDPERKYGVGHVGIVTRRAVGSTGGKVIHAIAAGIREVSLERLLDQKHGREYRGAIRLLPENRDDFTTFRWDGYLEIETSSDILYMLQADIREGRHLST